LSSPARTRRRASSPRRRLENRPKTSDTVPANAIATARTPVAADSERLAAAGEIEKPLAKPGISG
jgi:hypothetical protein